MIVIASATMPLLFIGIHNAWDVVTYTALELLLQTRDGKRGRGFLQ
jgi:hypothetical protein